MAGFAPKTEVNLAPPKEDIITKEELSQCTGEIEGKPIYVAIKGGYRIGCLSSRVRSGEERSPVSGRERERERERERGG